MAELQYSKAALDTLRFFHRRRFIVFVEGKEDVPFWSTVFALAGASDVYFKIAGGEREVVKYVSSIVDEGADIFVARDSDFSEFIGDMQDHPRIMHTYGYSIENTMCSVEALAALLRIHLFSNDDHNDEAQSWFSDSEATAFRLVVLDLAARLHGKGVEVPVGNATRFLDKKHARFSAASIASTNKSIEPKIAASAINAAAQSLATCGKPCRYYFRGHFILSAVAQFLCRRVHAVSGHSLVLSTDALYGALVAHLTTCLRMSVEWPYYENRVQRMLADV